MKYAAREKYGALPVSKGIPNFSKEVSYESRYTAN
jgi:hypothetical protein